MMAAIAENTSKAGARRRLIKLDKTQMMLMLFLTLVGIFMILPLFYIFNHALKPYSELFLYPPRIFVQQPTLTNFSEFFSLLKDSTIPASRYLFNSIVVAGLGTVSVVIVSALAAYPLSKHPFPGSKLLFSAIVISLMFVPEALQIPRYIVVAQLGIMDTYVGHILPHVAAPVSVFLVKQFMDQVPNDLIEAAKIDGAREFTVFMRIVIPVVMPSIATSSILTFQDIWNDTSTSTLFMQNDAMKTFPYYLSTLTNNLANSVARQGAVAAASLILFLPTLIIFLTFQRKGIATMAHSGIK